MSYDIYCYKSKSGKPDEIEADIVIEADNDKWATKDKDEVRKLKIVKNLMEFDSSLNAIDFKFGDISKMDVEILKENGKHFNSIEINSEEKEPHIQLKVFDNHVLITVPYTYQGEDAKAIFIRIAAYLNIIAIAAGYFVFDPQTGKTFDVLKSEFEGLNKYLSVSEDFY